MKLRIAAVVAALTLASAPAQAVITNITLSGGTSFANGGTGQIIAAPSVAATFVTGYNIVGFNEKQSFTIGLGGQSPRGDDIVSGVFGNIVSAVPVSSHFFILTPGGTGIGSRTSIGTITFNQNVIAVQRTENNMNNARSAQLTTGATDFTGIRGIENGDTFTLVNPKTISFSLTTGRNGQDTFRVLTAVPEPSTWVMLLAGFGMVGVAARRRKAVVAA